MFAWIAAVLFALAVIIDGAGLHAASPWLHGDTLMAAGMLCLALHSAGFGPTWGRRD